MENFFEIVTAEKYAPILETPWTIGLLVAKLFLLVFGLLVQRSIFKLVSRKSGRGINRMIISQQISMSLFYVYLVQQGVRLFIYPLKDLVGELGCYAFDLIELGGTILLQTSSFYASLFRYICVVHESILIRSNLTPLSLGNLLVFVHYSSALSFYIIVRTAGIITIGNGQSLLTCLGSYELTYGVKSGVYYCRGLSPWSLRWILCNGADIWALTTVSNVLDLYFLRRCIQSVESHTKTIKSLLSLKAFKQRIRENRTMFAVHAWQWMFEALISLVFVIVLKLSPFLDQENGSMNYQKVWGVVAMNCFTILNSFYLLGDQTFQRHVEKDGVFKAMAKALTQTY